MSYQTDEPCLVCRREGVDRTYHHIRSRGSGGGDERWNLMPLCFVCHYEVHNMGLFRFSVKYDQVFSYLLQNEWENLGHKWIHDE